MNWTPARYYRSLFLIGGIWNISMSLGVWIFGLLVPSTFGLLGMTAPSTLFFFHAMTGFIFSFGIGYIIVSRNTGENNAVVVLGVIAKSIFFVDCAISVSLGQANGILLAVGIIDLLFAILFAEFLSSVRKEIRPDQISHGDATEHNN